MWNRVYSSTHWNKKLYLALDLNTFAIFCSFVLKKIMCSILYFISIIVSEPQLSGGAGAIVLSNAVKKPLMVHFLCAPMMWSKQNRNDRTRWIRLASLYFSVLSLWLERSIWKTYSMVSVCFVFFIGQCQIFAVLAVDYPWSRDVVDAEQ